jgi:hypothetical protein
LEIKEQWQDQPELTVLLLDTLKMEENQELDYHQDQEKPYKEEQEQ